MTQVVMGKTRDAWIAIIASVLKCQFGTASYLFDAIIATEKFGTLAWYEQEFELKEKKMTRQEAENKVANIHGNTNSLLDALEALGLLKFEEEKVWGYSEDLLRTIKECRLSYTETEDFLYALEKRGYKVVRK